MILKLNHQKLEVFIVSRQFVLECYRLTKNFPSGEKFGIISQIRKATLSAHLNIAEGCSRKSETERKRFYEIARGSVIEIDAALDIASDLEYLNNADIKLLEEKMIACFKLLTGLIK